MKVKEVLGKVLAALITLVSSLDLAYAGIFSFCANNQNYMFTLEACPGGILFKSPVTINETCYCFPTDVAIYSSCKDVLRYSDPIRMPHSVTTCSRSGDIKNQEVQLLIPLHTKSPSPRYAYCPYIPSSCALKPRNKAFKRPSMRFNEVAEIEEVTKTRGTVSSGTSRRTTKGKQIVTTEQPTTEATSITTGSSPIASQQIINEAPNAEVTYDEAEPASPPIRTLSNELFSDFKNIEMSLYTTHPSVKRKLEMPHEMLSVAEMFAESEGSSFGRKLKIYKRMSDERDHAETSFILRSLSDKLVAEITEGPSYPTDSKGASLLKITSEMFKTLAPNEMIQDVTIDEVFRTFLSTHLFGSSDIDASNKFITDDLYHKVMLGLSLCQNRDEGFQEYVFESDTSCPPSVRSFVNLKTKKVISIDELKSKLPKEFSYVPEKENFIVGLMWKMVEAIHAECFGTWMSHDGVIPVFYWSFLEHFFLQEDVARLFYSESKGTTRYEGIIESDKPLQNVTSNVDLLLAAIHSKSQFPTFYSKPSQKTGNEEKVSDVDPEVPEISSRRKRSGMDFDLDAFEIWDGKAYCLQRFDTTKPPSIHNTFPLLHQVCHYN